MRDVIDEVLDRRGGVATRGMLLRSLGVGAFDDEVRRGHLVRVFPRAYARPWMADFPDIRERAALVSVGAPCALSHLSALRRWELPVRVDSDVHVSVPWTRNPRPQTPGIVVHHIKAPFPKVVRRDGLPTVVAAAAITTSWPMRHGPDQRAPLLAAARAGDVRTADIRHELRRSTRLKGRRALLELLDIIDDGCESELELWGYLDVFAIPGLNGANRQRKLRVRGRRYRVDLAYDDAQLAVELDGRAYHSSPEQWERDIARDTALATIGWQTIRLSHRRLTTDVAGCRRDVLATLRARRQIRVSA